MTSDQVVTLMGARCSVTKRLQAGSGYIPLREEAEGCGGTTVKESNLSFS